MQRERLKTTSSQLICIRLCCSTKTSENSDQKLSYWNLIVQSGWGAPSNSDVNDMTSSALVSDSSEYMMVWQWKLSAYKFHTLLMVVLAAQDYSMWTVTTICQANWQKARVTSVDICEGSLHIYRTMGELRSPEGLLKLHHTPYGRFASQGSTSPIFTLGSSTC